MRDEEGLEGGGWMDGAGGEEVLRYRITSEKRFTMESNAILLSSGRLFLR